MFSIMHADAPSPVQPLLHLFATALAEVRFGDVDTQSLARFAEEAQAASDAVAAAQAALDAARATLDERQQALLVHAHRALAYARVYAENDESLRARVDAIRLPSPARRPRSDAAATLVLSSEPAPAPRPRGRPRKHPLPAEPEPTLAGVVAPAAAE